MHDLVDKIEKGMKIGEDHLKSSLKMVIDMLIQLKEAFDYDAQEILSMAKNKTKVKDIWMVANQTFIDAGTEIVSGAQKLLVLDEKIRKTLRKDTLNATALNTLVNKMKKLADTYAVEVEQIVANVALDIEERRSALEKVKRKKSKSKIMSKTD